MTTTTPNSLAAAMAALGYNFKRPELLEQAMTHRSRASEQGESAAAERGADAMLRDNERLEFLGDAVVDLAVAQLLYQRHPRLREGDLSRLRAALVNEEHLARLALEIGLDGLIRLGRGEALSGGNRKPSILAAAFEALVGAVYLDGGHEAAQALLSRLFEPWVARPPSLIQSDSKTALQEILQEIRGQAPAYRLEAEEGPAHDRRFTVSVLLGDQVLGRGRDRSKKGAERLAAAQALKTVEKWQGVW